MGDEVKKVVITGFGQMHFLSHPTRVTLLRLLGFRVIWRVETVTCGRNVVGSAPTQFTLLPKEILNPHVTERLHRRNVPDPRWC